MEQIEYTRTVVPSSMRSPYWKYFGFPSDNANNILTRQKIVCTICNTAITYNKNTSNLRTHLMSKHFEIFQRIITTLGGGKEQTGDKDFNETTTEEGYMPETINSTPNKRLCGEPQQHIGDTLEWRTNTVSENFIIIPESNKLEQRENDPNRNFCSNLQIENCNINFEGNLNDTELVEIVELSDENINNRNFEKNLNEVTPFALETNNHLERKNLTDSIEIMLADMVQTDLLTLDALTKEGFYNYNQLLTGIGIDEETIERIAEVIEKRFIKTQEIINDHVADLSEMEPFSLSIETYVDNGHDKVMNIYYNYLNINRTELDSILYRSCTINYTTSPNISNLLSDLNLKNCSGIVLPCLEKVHDSILEFAKSYEIPIVECLESMLTNCLRKICESCELLVDFDRIIRNEIKILDNKQYRPKFGCYWSKLEVLENILKNFKQLDLEQWEELQKCIDYLKPLKMALNIVADEKLPSCSLIRPIIIKLYEEHFTQTKYQTSAKIVLIQKILEKDLYEKIIMQNFLKEATFFDPRFHRDFAFPDTVFSLKEIKSHIVKRFKGVLNITEIKSYVESAAKETFTNSLTSSGKSSSLKTFFNRGSNSIRSEFVQDVKTDLDTELELYHMNNCLDLDQSPVLWWQQARNCYKQLSKISEFYFTVPCCYMPRMQYLNFEKRRFILERRKNLNQLCQTESKLWYLFYNNWITNSM